MADHPLLQLLKDDEFFTTTDPNEQAQIIARQDAESRLQHLDALLHVRTVALKKTWMKRQLLTPVHTYTQPGQRGAVTKQ
jgi:hypothetical protein